MSTISPVDLSTYVPGEDVDADALVREELEILRALVKHDVPSVTFTINELADFFRGAIFGELVSRHITNDMTAENVMVLLKDYRARVKKESEDFWEAKQRIGRMNSDLEAVRRVFGTLPQ